MFHLQPRVHLEEIEVLLLVDQELNGASIRVSSSLRDANGDLAHSAPHVGINEGRRRFLDYFLMTALQRTLAFSEVDGVSMLVSEHLHLDVAGIDDRLLDINFAVAERSFRFAARTFERRPQLFGRVDEAHALSTASSGRFQHHGIADARGDLFGLLERFEATRRARHERNARALHRLACSSLRAHCVHGGSGGTDELYACVCAGAGKLRILGKKAVSRVDGICSRSRGHVENLLDVEIGLGCDWCPDWVRFIGFANVQRGAIHVRVDGNRGNPHLVAGADDAYGNLAAVRDENLLKHETTRNDGLRGPAVKPDIVPNWLSSMLCFACRVPCPAVGGKESKAGREL